MTIKDIYYSVISSLNDRELAIVINETTDDTLKSAALISQKKRQQNIAMLLLEVRERAKEVFPNADFMPGDPCPVGMKVYRQVANDWQAFEVSGEVNPNQSEECLRFWWKVKSLENPKDPSFGDSDHYILEWPPGLRKEKP